MKRIHIINQLIFGVGIMLLMGMLSGCVMIPVGSDINSKTVIGTRADNTGKVCEQIVHYDKRLDFIAIGLTPNGLIASSWFGYSRYAVITKDSKHMIWSMEHFPSLAWTKVNLATPIPNSDRWITVEDKKCTAEERDICLIVFSAQKGKILRHRFKHVIQYAPKNVKTVLGSGYIEGNADLSWLRIHETGKISLVNTETGKVYRENECLPNFIPAEINWKEMEQLLEQPMLRK